MELQSQVTSLQSQLGTKLGNTPTDLKAASRTIRDELQSNGSAPLSLTKLSGVAAQPQVAAVSSNVPVIQQQEGMLIQQNGQLYTVQGGQLIPALKSGDLTEATSGVLTITGGVGAVLGSGTAIQVKKATNAQNGYLSAADWTAFNGKQDSLTYTPLNRANNLSDLANAAIARTNLGLALVASSGTYADLTGKPTIPAAQVAANLANATSTGVTGTLPIANGGTGAITAAAALAALGGASLSGTNTFAAAQTFSAGVTLSSPASVTIGTGWIVWTPTVTCGGSMTASGVTVTDAQYIRLGPLVYFKVIVSFTLAGTAANIVYVSIPVAAVGANSAASGLVTFGGSNLLAGACFVQGGSSLLVCCPTGQVSWSLGSASAWVEGFYRCA